MHGTTLRCAIAVLALSALAGAARAASSIVLPRAGQVGVGVGGQYGRCCDSGSLGTEFGSGPGLGVRLRYRMRFERAIGLSFESADSIRRARGAAGADSRIRVRKQLTLILSGVDIYQMFGTRDAHHQVPERAGSGSRRPRRKLDERRDRVPVGGTACT